MNTLFNWLSQTLSVTKMSLLTIPERKGSAAASAFGIAGVVAVLVGVLSIAQGFRSAMVASGSPDTAIVLRSGSDAEMMSFIAGQDARLIADAPGIASSPDGPLASQELFVILNLPKRSTGTDANVPLRGVAPAAFRVRDGLEIVAGRPFERGRNEVIVGYGAAAQFSGLELGDKINVGRGAWTVVGMFRDRGGISESEIWTDGPTLQAAYNRGNSFQSVYVKLESVDAFSRFKAALEAEPRINVKVVRQTEYYAEQSEMLYNLITGLGTIVAGLMGVGAVFGALNTMYTSVAARSREIATLRALGFGSSPVVVSILLESVVLAAAGGTAGALLAYLAFDGFQAATLNWQSFSQVAFAFQVGPALLIQGVAYAILIGLVGGFFPAWRAARLPVAIALREL